MGSIKETLAISALVRKHHIQFMTTLATVNAIILIGNGIISAVSGGSAAAGESNKLEKSIESLRELLIPEDAFDKESKVQKALRILEEEVAKGPIAIRAMTAPKTRGRITRRRSSDVPTEPGTKP